MSRDLAALAVAALAALGVYLCLGSPPTTSRPTMRRTLHAMLARAGVDETRRRDVLLVSVAGGVAVGLLVFSVFGTLLPAVMAGAVGTVAPIAGSRHRAVVERATAADAWPRLLEELRLRTSSLGRSIPQALFEVGRNAPPIMAAGFETAHREWLMSTDFERTLAVLKRELADPTADVVAETLLVAHQIGGTDLDQRIEALIEDRITETQARKDARAKQAAARFARRFVLFVPAGMAVAGMSVGNGRDAFGTPTGQLLTAVAIGLTAVCWVWSGLILRLPPEERVFPS